MKRMKIPWAYDWGLAVYLAAIRVASLFSAKAREWVDGRRGWEENLVGNLALKFAKPGKRIWIHCASLGEFEQGRPLIEALRQEYADANILLSFFSPSGYEVRKDYIGADHVCYLPADTPSNAVRFLDIVRPDLAVIVKYEFWLHVLTGMFLRDVPVILVSALFRPGQFFFRSYGRRWLEILRGFRHIFAQDESSWNLLNQHGITRCSVAGDTRVDRVAALAAEDKRIPVIEAFAEDAHLLIAGSTWPKDEALLAGLWKSGIPAGWKMVIAPHQIAGPGLKRLEEMFPEPVLRYSAAEPQFVGRYRILIIDNVGMLSALYRYGRIAYIGGGFGAGIHNTLEPMAFGLPVIFGPKFRKFREAVTLVGTGGAISVHNAAALQAAFHHFASPAGLEQAAAATADYIAQNRGATSKIMQFISKDIID